MKSGQDQTEQRRIAEALARVAYAQDRVRVASLDIADCIALVCCGFGVYAISLDGEPRRILYGRFHGIRHQGDHILIFEVCDRTRNRNRFGRMLRLALDGDRLGEPEIVVRGLDNQSHQLAMFDGMIHLVDTANQLIERYTPDGQRIDAIAPFPFVRGDPAGGDYHHMNCIARLGSGADGRIGVMLHNGKLKRPGGGDRPSEVAWFTPDWQLISLQTLPGYGCHDIVRDEAGVIWHCGSMDGELINSDGLRHKVTDMMTRGLDFSDDLVIVGACIFGERSTRDYFMGKLYLLDRALRIEREIDLPSAPMDLIALHPAST